MEYTDLPGIEIFRPGKWHGRYYGPDEMRRMVRNSNRMRGYFRAPLKLTHHQEQPGLLSQAAMGMTARYYLKRGQDGLPVVCADIEHVPTVLADAIRNHFPGVSVEKYRYLEQDGEKIPDVVRTIAFLGAEPPAVKGLKSAYPGIFQELAHGGVECFQIGGSQMLNIAKYREALSMNEEDLAAAVGMAVEEIRSFENGEEQPSEEQLQDIADALGVSVEELQAMPEDEGGDKPEGNKPAMFSEFDVQSMIEQAVNKAIVRERKDWNSKIDALTEKFKRTETELFEERKNGKQQAIAATLKSLYEPNEDGFALPAVLKEKGIERFMESLNDRDVEQFAEGVEKTPLEMFTELLGTIKTVGLVDTVERVDQSLPGKKGEPKTMNDAVEMFAENPENKERPYSQVWQMAADAYPHLVTA